MDRHSARRNANLENFFTDDVKYRRDTDVPLPIITKNIMNTTCQQRRNIENSFMIHTITQRLLKVLGCLIKKTWEI